MRWEIGRLADATCRFAVGIPARARVAAGRAGVSRLVLARSMWRREAFRDVTRCMVLCRVEAAVPGFFSVQMVGVGWGPFGIGARHRMSDGHGIRMLVTKAADCKATELNILIVRDRGLPVAMICRPGPVGGCGTSGFPP